MDHQLLYSKSVTRKPSRRVAAAVKSAVKIICKVARRELRVAKEGREHGPCGWGGAGRARIHPPWPPCVWHEATKRGCDRKGIGRETLANLHADGEKSAAASPIRIGISRKKKKKKKKKESETKFH